MIATRPARRSGGASKWVRTNLFSNRWNTALTIVTLLVGLTITYSLGNFVFVSAEWESVEVNRRLLFLAIYPSGEEWRLWPPVMLFASVAGLGYGLWSRAGIREYVIGSGVAAFVFLFLVEGNTALLTAVMVGVAIVGYRVGRAARDSRIDTAARRIAIGSGVAIVPLALLMLNLMLATVGIGLGFPLGVLLALGRTSSLKVISFASTAYIEFVRAGPLILWLAMARFVLPDFLPSVGGLDDVSLVVRAMMVMAGFSAAYIAEVVRGGLQTIPRGQHEAADAIGLNTFQSTWFIVLPQALRSVIPALVNRFVSLWKDTSLVVVLGFVDLLGAARAIPAQPDFVGRQAEALLFAALIFWSVSFTMSRLSARIERQLGVGVR